MAIINKSALVRYSASQMYELVDDIDAYPEFLPWCKNATVLSRDEDEVHATLALSRGGIHKTFTTCNRLQKGKMIEMRLVDGPFQHLEGFWRFEKLGEGACKVSLDLEFEFSNRLLDVTLGPIFNQIANSLVDAFCERAVNSYGRP